MLEDRWTPAGIVTGSLANGTWTLIGDAEANDIRITPTAILNQFEVSGQNGTTVAGVVNPSKVQHIVVKLRAGDDLVEVNQTGAFARLLGNLTITGGDGANQIKINDFKMKNLTVLNGTNTSGADVLDLADSLVQRNVTINNGSGNTQTRIVRSGYNSAIGRVGGHVTIVNGAGEDTTEIFDTHVGGNVIVKNGLPGDEAGFVNILSHYNLPSRSIIGGSVSVSYLAGVVDYDGIWDTEVFGNVKFRYGSDYSEVNFAGSPQPVRIHGNLTVIGQGNTRVDVGTLNDPVGLIVDKNFTILTGGGTDEITIRGLSVGGATRLVTGVGNDSIRIDGSSFTGPTTILAGSGVDTLLIEQDAGTEYGTQFANALTLHMGADNDTLTVGAANDRTRLVELFGLAVLDGGDGEDTFNRFNLDPTLGKPINASFETINL
jgi:hypothetical protein